MALGAAIAERFMAARFGEWMAHKTYAYISDGAVEEEMPETGKKTPKEKKNALKNAYNCRPARAGSARRPAPRPDGSCRRH